MRRLFDKQLYYWLISYVFIMIISVIISCLFAAMAIKVINKEAERYNEIIVDHTQAIFDEYFNNLDKSANKTLYSAPVSNILYSKQMNEEKRLEWAKAVIRDLAMNGENSIIEKSFLVYKDKNISFDDEGFYSADMMYKIFFSDSYSDKDEWMKDIFTTRGLEYKMRENTEGGRNLYMIRTYVDYGMNMPVAFVAKIDCELIDSKLSSSIEQTGANFYIVNGDEDVLFSTTDKRKLNFSIAQNGIIDVDSEKQIMRSKASDYMSNWSYVYTVPNDNYLDHVRSLQINFIMLYLAFMIIGGFFAYRFSLYNYMPLQLLVKRLGKELKRKEHESEFKYIERAIAVINNERRTVNEVINKQKKQIKNQKLVDVLSGVKSYETEFGYEGFSVAVFDIRDIGVLGVEDFGNEEKNSNDILMAQFVIENTVSEVLEEYADVFFCSMGDGYTGVINYSTSKCNTEIITDKLSFIIKYLEKNLNMKIICSLSKSSSDSKSLYNLYESAYENLHGISEYNSDGVYLCDDGAFDSFVYRYDVKTEHNLFKYINSGNEEQAVKLIKDIFNENVEENHLSLRASGVLVNDVISTVLKVIAGKDNKESVDTAALCSLTVQLARNKNVMEIVEQLCKYVEEVCRLTDTNEMNYTDERIELIKSYIQEHYSDIDLSINKVAEIFNITPNYLSSYFKSCTQERMLDYIMRVRIESAKRQLSETEKYIKDIASDVGFVDVNTFIRVFKKYEGITPGQYRTDICK